MPSLYASVVTGAWLIGVSDVVVYGLVWVLLLTSRIPYRIRALTFIIAMLYLGALLVFTVGIASGQLVWLAFPLVLSILLCSGATPIYIGVTVLLIFTAVTILLRRDTLPWSISMATWLIACGNYIAVLGAVAGGVGYLISRIAAALQEEKTLSADREFLVTEIHHRVKNNLQTLISLLRIQSQDAPTVETRCELLHAEFRVLAVSRAHALVYPGARADRVSLAELALTVAQEGNRLLDARATILTSAGSSTIEAASAVPIAVALAEVLYAFVGCLDERPAGREIALELEIPEGGRSVALGCRPLAESRDLGQLLAFARAVAGGFGAQLDIDRAGPNAYAILTLPAEEPDRR